jgi:light-independent protochlorophyllide reductase subunit B
MRLAYWIYQGTAHHGVARIANSMRGVHAVFHAPQGDDYITPIFTMLERTPAFPPHTTSVVSGRDLAQGTLQLPATLQQVAATHQPALIVVAASCSTILLQENLEIAVQSADIDTETLVYDVNPYRVQEVAAADELFRLLVQRFAREQPLTARPSANIIGPASLGFHARPDLIALRRMLAALGVEVNVVAPWGATPHDLARLPAAWVNIAPYRELGTQAARFLAKQFGTPALCDAPIGVQPTLAWLQRLVALLNEAGTRAGGPAVEMPPLTAFSLDGLSTPSSVPWFARTADMESFSSKRAFVFGDATHTVGVARFLHDELGMQIAGAGTYLPQEADWIREQLTGYLADDADDILVTEEFQQVAQRIEDLLPDLVCGTQMERHSCRKLDVPALVIAPPTHIENHLLGYYPMLGFDGADVIADRVYTTTKLGLEKHLIDMFGDAGLEYEEQAGQSSQSSQNGQQAAPETAALPQAAASESTTPGQISWTPEAEAMLKKIPFFVRGRVRRNTEKFAAEQGYSSVTAEVLRAAKEALGG